MNSSDIKPTDSFKASSEIVIRDLGHEMCLYSPSNGLIMTLNETASEIWKLFENLQKTEQVIEHISNKYKNENPDKVRDDVTNTISQMYEKGFLTKE